MYDFKRFQMNTTIDLEGKTQLKKDDVLDTELTIIDFSFAKTSNGETSVIIFKEKPDKFLFGGKVITNLLKDINDDPEAVKALKEEGLKVRFFNSTSRSGKDYINVEIL